MLAGKIGVVTTKWTLLPGLPDELDETQAVVYRQTVQDGVPQLGGRHLVWPDGQVWQQRADGRWQRSTMAVEDLVPPGWEPVGA